MTRYIDCPTCKEPALWSPENKFRPFCCERCKMIDLGEWASGSYSIPESKSSNDFSSSDDPSNRTSESDTHDQGFTPYSDGDIIRH